MTIRCENCSALHWLLERVKTSSKNSLRFENCCKQGSVILEPPKDPSQFLRHLFESDDVQSKHFRGNIRQYNSAFAFTSLKYQPDTRLGPGGYKCFSIHGQLYHMSRPLSFHDQNQEMDATYAQLYLYDSGIASARRSENNPSLNQILLQQLTAMLYECNLFIAIYKTTFERLQDPGNSPDIRIILNPQMRLLLEKGADCRRNNLPTADEIAIIIPDEYDRASFRDIVLACRQSENDAPIFQNISSTTAAYMPLHYVLLFPCGDLGWHWAFRLHDPNNSRKNGCITQ